MTNFTEYLFQSTKSDASLFYADHSLETKTSGTCDLLVNIEHNSVQLALKEKRSGRLLAIEFIQNNSRSDGWKNQLENVTALSKLLRNYEFSRVSVGFNSKEFTLVPEALFRKGDEISYFRNNYNSLSENKIHVEFIPSFRLYTIFNIENELENEVNHLFQDPKLWHSSQAILTGLSFQTKADTGHQIILNIHSDTFDIVATENKKLLLMNSFSFKTNEDILYYTLFVFEQLNLNPEKTPVVLTGEIDADTPLYLLLYKYILTVVFPESPSNLLNIFTDSGLPFHKCSTLYSFSLCE